MKKTSSQKKPFKQTINATTENLLELENYSPPRDSFQNSYILNHDHFQKQLDIHKKNLEFGSSHHPNREDEFDEIPTKENGEQTNYSAKKAQNLLGKYQYRALGTGVSGTKDIDKEIEKKEKERLLDDMIRKHKDEMAERKYGLVPTQYAKEINQKIDQMKYEMEPILKSLSKTKEFSNYPFTYNLLSKACIKSVCVNSEKITEMMIDEILFEIIDILNEIEANEKEEEKNEEKKNILNEYIEAIKDLQCDQDEILNQTRGIYLKQIRDIEHGEEIVKMDKKNYIRIIETREDFVNKILNDKINLESAMDKKNISDKKFVNRTKDVGERLITEIFEEMYEEFENAQEEFVEKLFHQEFFQK